MFLRGNRRRKDGKLHEYWNVVEKRRLSDGRIAQRQVLYLGEINASQREAWRKTVEVFDEGQRRQVALFPVGSLPGDRTTHTQDYRRSATPRQPAPACRVVENSANHLQQYQSHSFTAGGELRKLG